MRRIYLWILLAIVFIGAGAYFWATQTESKIYKDPKYGFEVSVPSGFSDAGTNDGIYAYNKYFKKGDVQLYIVISKNETKINNQEALKEVKAVATAIKNSKTVTVDDLSATEQFEDYSKVTNGDPGCQLAAYFSQGGVSHQIMYFSSNCNEITDGQAEYDAVLASYHQL